MYAVIIIIIIVCISLLSYIHSMLNQMGAIYKIMNLLLVCRDFVCENGKGDGSV